MRSLVLTVVSLFGVLATHVTLAQPTLSTFDSTKWRMQADIGVFPTANRIGVGWYPNYSLRAGVGRGNSDFSTYVFFDFCFFKLSKPGGLHEFLDKGASRRDIAVYPAIWIYRFLFLGAGIYNTHSDHVRITSDFGVDTWSGSDFSGWRLLATVGLTWDMKVTQTVTIPFGLYYRNPGYYADSALLGIRAGISVHIN